MAKSQIIKDLANGSIDTQTSIGRIIPAEYYPYIAKCNNDMGMVIQSAEIQLNMPQILIFSRKLKTSYWIFCAILKNNLEIWMS